MLGVVGAAFAVPAIAQDTSLGVRKWLPYDFDDGVPPPRDTDVEEAQMLVGMKRQRNPAVIAEIRRQDKDVMNEFFDMAGVKREPNSYMDWVTESLVQETVAVIFPIKRKFSRVRPSYIKPEIDPVIEVPWHAAYPSGHASQGRFMSRFFANCFPKLEYEFLELGDRIGKNREIAGVHYPSDTEAGRALGDRMWLAVRSKIQQIER
jgi:acid phosphatase (class A)